MNEQVPFYMARHAYTIQSMSACVRLVNGGPSRSGGLWYILRRTRHVSIMPMPSILLHEYALRVSHLYFRICTDARVFARHTLSPRKRKLKFP